MSNFKKSIFFLILVSLSVLFSKSNMVFAQDGWGSFGDNITWHYYENSGLLEIKGSGQMPGSYTDFNISGTSSIPWIDYKQNVKTVTIEEGITGICDEAFEGFNKLTSVSLPSTVTTMGRYCFYGANLQSITLPKNLSYMGFACFKKSGIFKELIIPSALKVIPLCAFSDCTNLENVTIENGVQIIGACFDGTSIKTLSLPPSVTTLNGTFYQMDKLVSVVIPETVTEVSEELFFGDDNLRYVEYNCKCAVKENCFGGCDNLRAVKLGEGVKSIDYFSFWDDKSLKAIFVPRSVTTINNAAFYSTNQTITFYGYVGTTAYDYAGVHNNIDFVDVSLNTGMQKWNEVWISSQKIELDETNASISLSKVTYSYNGKQNKPKVKVLYDKKQYLRDGIDYIVEYSKDCKGVGEKNIVIIFKGDYTGTIKKKYTIKPAKPKIKKLKGIRKGIKLELKKQKNELSGYEIKYSYSNTMRYSTIKKIKKKNSQIKKLLCNQIYYVRIRAYKKSNGKIFYSDWSKIRKIKTK